MTFEAQVTHNGLTGSKAARNPSSRLSQLVGYIKLAKHQGNKATRKGYVEFFADHLKKRPDDLFKLALKTGVMVDTGEIIEHGQKVIDLGPNADQVVISETVHQMLEWNKR